MSFQMRRPVGVSDIPSLCNVYFSAFSDTVIGRQVFPATSETARKFWLDTLEKDIKDPNAEVLITTYRADDEAEEEIVGYAKWVRPGTPVEMPPPADAWPQDGSPELAVNFFGALAKSHKRIMQGKPHWYLELIGVRKEWMGKGAASAMMRWGIEKADEDGLGCFLEATPNGRGMYEKYGFRVVGEEAFESSHGKVVEFYMLHEAEINLA